MTGLDEQGAGMGGAGCTARCAVHVGDMCVRVATGAISAISSPTLDCLLSVTEERGWGWGVFRDRMQRTAYVATQDQQASGLRVIVPAPHVHTIIITEQLCGGREGYSERGEGRWSGRERFGAAWE
jgi:hypothetical protein